MLIGAGIALAVSVAGLGGYTAFQRQDREEAALAQRQKDVAVKGSSVMPFDLAETTHTFTDRTDGGVQTVTANDPADSRNIKLIQSHLREEQAKFARGEFTDPAAIHGADMPGLADLKAGAARIRVRYTPLADGARLTYATTEPRLVAALHAWFAAQTMDHGHE